MNDKGLNDLGKEVISDVDKKDSNISENLTNFYNNDKLVKNTQTTNVYSGQTTLNNNNSTNKMEQLMSVDTGENKSNPMYDFVVGLKKDFFNFFNFKKIETENDYNIRLKSATNITIIELIVAISKFVFLVDSNMLKMIITIIPIALLGYTFFSLKKGDRLAILTGIIASVILILSFKIISVIVSVIYLIGMLLLLRYKKTP